MADFNCKVKPRPRPQLKAKVGQVSTGTSRLIFTHTFNGEKNLGEIGPIRQYLPDYAALRARSWQSYLESEITQIIMGRWITWMIGEGLKLQSEPAVKVLKIYGIDLDINKFTEDVEALYSVYCDSREADHSRMQTKQELSAEVLKNAVIGGDCLVVMRLENLTPTIQVVDGAHISNPIGSGSETFPTVLANGNRIENGIELSPSNEHIAYYVKKAGTPMEFERIVARSDAGTLMAFMVYGSRYRIDNHRGLPLISVVLETIKKLERYKEATVGSAEERQKIAYYITHGPTSNEINPLVQQIAKVSGWDETESFPTDVVGQQLADKIAATTNKQTFNMGRDSKLETLATDAEIHFKDFYTVNFDIVCACIGIPPNVALSKYDNNYSASRAAIKDWEYSLRVGRKKHANQFEKPVYTFWLQVQILKNLIRAAEYLRAWVDGNWMVMEAYVRARFVGASVPHIDPLKEVQAVREKLGSTGAALPLTTLEAATEELDGGGSMENLAQYATELKKSKQLGVEDPKPEPPALPGKGQGE
jgi:capsid protein